jgi:hypothetical protein
MDKSVDVILKQSEVQSSAWHTVVNFTKPFKNKFSPCFFPRKGINLNTMEEKQLLNLLVKLALRGQFHQHFKRAFFV